MSSISRSTIREKLLKFEEIGKRRVKPHDRLKLSRYWLTRGHMILLKSSTLAVKNKKEKNNVVQILQNRKEKIWQYSQHGDSVTRSVSQILTNVNNYQQKI